MSSVAQLGYVKASARDSVATLLSLAEVRVEWVVAGLVGLINVALMRPLSHYRFWWHWLGGRTWFLGYSAYALVAAATGILSNVGAHAVGPNPQQHSLMHALLAALAGAALLRADVGHPVRNRRDQAANLAAPLVTWLGVGLDHAARGQIEIWARDLKDDELENAAGLIASDAGRPGSKVQRAMISANVRALSSSRSAYARGALIGAIAHGYLEGDRMRQKSG
jgi:hypothetical protein